MVLVGVEYDVDPAADKEARAHVREDIETAAAASFAALARYGLHANLNPAVLDVGKRATGTGGGFGVAADTATQVPQNTGMQPAASPAARNRWLKTFSKAEGSLAARRLREAARLKALQRTPYPMVLARLKLLLERLTLLLEQEDADSPKAMHQGGRTNMVMRTASFSMLQKEAGLAPSLQPVSPVKRVNMSSDVGPSSPSFAARPGSPLDMANDLPPIERVREELAITFAYVSDFLRKVPEETRVASINYARMENYKKDQTVYMICDAPTKFYMILTGAVEVWAHPVGEPRKRTVLANLKRGQSFGEKDILNHELRTECVTPTSNCTFLVLDAEPFKAVFSDHFEQLLARAQDFFMHHVHMFRKVPPEDGQAIVRHMLLSSYPAGKDWEPALEQQVYFIKSGAANLESHDKRTMQSVVITRSMLGLNQQEAADTTINLTNPDTPPLADSGVLSNVVMRDGRAVGTLGHEEEIRRLKRLLIPKKVIAALGVGSHFGGGPAAMGTGDLQNSLRVMSTTEIEAYHCHIEVLRKHASPALLSALRDDIAFKLTYCYGRMNMLGPEPVVGHQDSLLAVCLNKPKEKEQVSTVRDEIMAMHQTHHALVGADNNNAANKQSMSGVVSKPRRKRAQKQVHEPGHYSPEVEKALKYINSLQAHNHMVQAGAQDSMTYAGNKVGGGATEAMLPIPGYMSYLVSEGATPAERFWSQPMLHATSSRTAALTPLLKQVYPEGLAPLAEKVEQLIIRTQYAAKQAGAELSGPVFNPGSMHGMRTATPQGAGKQWHSMSGRYRLDSPHWEEDGTPGFIAEPVPEAVTVHAPSHDGFANGSMLTAWQQAPYTQGSNRLEGRPATCPCPAGALLSAGEVWARTREVQTPVIRQVLTYEEIAKLKST